MGIIGLVLAGVGGIILGFSLMMRMLANRIMTTNILFLITTMGTFDSDSSMLIITILPLISQGQRMLNSSTIFTIVGALIIITGAILAIVGWTRYYQLEHGKI